MSDGPYKLSNVVLTTHPPQYTVTGPHLVKTAGMSQTAACILADTLNLAHAHATAAAARRVRELEEALAAMVRAFESGWPSHTTESIGGLGHMPGESCNACRMMRPYKDAQSALAGKERSDGAE